MLASNIFITKINKGSLKTLKKLNLLISANFEMFANIDSLKTFETLKCLQMFNAKKSYFHGKVLTMVVILKTMVNYSCEITMVIQ